MPPALGPGEIHVWRAALDMPDDVMQSLERTLAASELTVADSYRREPLRARFVARRGILRNLLGQYLRVEPAYVSFEVSVGTETPARPLSVNGSRWRARAWTLLDLPPVDGAVGALAVRLIRLHTAFWEWRTCLPASLSRSPPASP